MPNSCQKFMWDKKYPPGFSRANKNIAGRENALRAEFGVRERQKNGKQCFDNDETLDEIAVDPVTYKVKRKALNGRRYKDLFKAKKDNAAGNVHLRFKICV